MIILFPIKDKFIEYIYYVKNRGILLEHLDYDFYDLPIYKNDLELEDYEE